MIQLDTWQKKKLSFEKNETARLSLWNLLHKEERAFLKVSEQKSKVIKIMLQKNVAVYRTHQK